MTRCVPTLAAVFLVASAFFSQPEPPEAAGGTNIIPRPRFEEARDGHVVLAEVGKPIALVRSGIPGESVPVQKGFDLLAVRLRSLGTAGIEKNGRLATLTVSQVSGVELAEQLTKAAGEKLDAKRLPQAYTLRAIGDRVSITACGEVGLYYGLVSLTQMVHLDQEGKTVVPAVAIADWPEVTFRLAKTSASMNPPERVAAFAAWLPLMKMNLIGLQYHGNQSKNPEPHFSANIETHCPRFRREGVLQSIVYFCPFRGRRDAANRKPGGAYAMSEQADREAYADFLRWIMAQGAHGIEVDYNDWPGSRDFPIADVLNLACDAIGKEHPNAFVLYCPAAVGRESYRGMASEELGRTLSEVPKKVWPLWTGMQTLITSPLETEQVEQWTRIAGRRPYLWVNRVSLGVPKHVARQLPGDGAYVFRGEYLPKDLNRLFEGVHFNAGISKDHNQLDEEFASRSLAYLATAADYVWNPHDWDAAESVRRADHFVEIMSPLLSSQRLRFEATSSNLRASCSSRKPSCCSCSTASVTRAR